MQSLIYAISGLDNYDLSEQNLAALDFERAVLRGADFTKSNLQGARLKEACLAGAVFTGAFLQNADLSFADLTDACFYGAKLSGANLEGAILNGSDLSEKKQVMLDKNTLNAVLDLCDCAHKMRVATNTLWWANNPEEHRDMGRPPTVEEAESEHQRAFAALETAEHLVRKTIERSIK
jgi:uncharacterized protein YjbI with pentapeptide repeats